LRDKTKIKFRAGHARITGIEIARACARIGVGSVFYTSQFRQEALIDTSIIHDTLAVIANEVKQSSKTKMHFFKPSGLPRRLRLLMKLLANRLSQQAGKSLVIAMTALLDCRVGFAS